MRFQNGVNVNSNAADSRLAAAAGSGATGAIQNGNSTANGEGLHLASSKLNGNGNTPRNGDRHDESSASSFAMLGSTGIKQPDYMGHDRMELTRIIMQALYDMGYEDSAAQLEVESECSLESRDVTEFRSAVLSGHWDRAEELLVRLELREDSDISVLLFYLRQQKFLELLEARNLSKALVVLRNELTPLNQQSETLKQLSSLIMCLTAEDLMKRANWDGAKGTSRQKLLTELSQHISPSTMVPEHRLASLLTEVKQTQIKKCLYHNTADSPSLYSTHICDASDFPLYQYKILREHDDEIWDVQFCHDGSKFSTTSKDGTCIVWDTSEFSPRHRLRGHSRSIIFSIWSPDDTKLLTGSHDKTAKVWDIQTGKLLASIEHNSYAVHGGAWLPDSNHFVTASPDRDIIIWDLNGAIIRKYHGPRFVAVAATPNGKYLVATTADFSVLVFDLQTLHLQYSVALDKCAVTITISRDSKHALLNVVNDPNSPEIPLLDIESGKIIRKYEGAKHLDNVIRSCFGGADENFVASGSEDEHIHIWHRDYAVLLAKIPGHTGVVNAVSWNPRDPDMFASAGDDGTVRIWTRPPSTSKGKIKAELCH